MNMDIKVEIDRAAKVGQKLEDLVSGKSVTPPPTEMLFSLAFGHSSSTIPRG